MMSVPAEKAAPSRLTLFAAQVTVFVLLLASNVSQRVSFKFIGYFLGSYPYFVLLSISGAFVPIFAVICAVIVLKYDGFEPETKTWQRMGIYAIIGCCNAMQGAGMVFANPYVAGYLQTLLQQGVIPFTFLISLIALRVSFSMQQYVGVVLIIVGFCVEFVPDYTSHASVPQGQSDLVWSMIFLASQLPVALAAVLQEHVFSASPVNPFLMMFWASTTQFLTLLLLGPLDALRLPGEMTSASTALHKFASDMAYAYSVTNREEGASTTLICCVLTMFLAQMAQAFMVKVSSAAFTVMCLAFVVPVAAVAFAMPAVMGAHAEHLNSGAAIALFFVFVGISFYQLASQPVCSPDEAPNDLDAGLLCEEPHQSPPGSPGSSRKFSALCVGGVGIIHSEYSNARRTDCSIFEERTLSDARKRSHSC